MPPLTASALTDKLVLVTGASRRIGAVLARHLHAAGARLAVHYRRDRAAAQALVEEFCAGRPGSARAYGADVSDPATLAAMVKAIAEDFGRIDALVNNASSFYPTPLGQIDLAAWEDLVGSNFKGPLFLSQAVAPYLRARQGAIVNITDIHAERPLRGYPLYSAAKGALLTLTRALALELAPEVRVNAVAPGAILWPDDGQFTAAEQDEIVAHVPLARPGRAEDIAAAVLFLLVDAPYVTGQVLNVDGGRTARL